MPLADNPAALVTSSLTDAQLAKLKQEFSVITYDTAMANSEGYSTLTKAIATLRDARGNLEDGRKAVKQPYLDACNQIDAEAKRIQSAIVAVETPLKTIKDRVDAEKARIKKEKEEAERKAAEEAMRKKIAEENRIKAEEEAKRKAEEDRLRVEREAAEKAERDRILAEQEAQASAAKAEADRLAAELAAERAKIEAERAEMEAFKKQQAEEAEKNRQLIEQQQAKIVEYRQIASERGVEIAKQDQQIEELEQDVVEAGEEAAAQIKAAKDACVIGHERQQDIPELMLLADGLEAFPMPKVESDWARELVKQLRDELASLAEMLRARAHSPYPVAATDDDLTV